MFKFLTKFHFITSLGAVFLYAESCYQLNIDFLNIPEQLAFVFLLTLGAYNGISWVGLKPKIPDLLNLFYFSLSVLSIISCISIIINFDYNNYFYLFHLVLLAFLYAIPILGLTLRAIPLLKIVIITYCWTSVTVILPSQINLWNSDAYTALLWSRITFIALISIGFDLYQIETDKKEGIITLPIVMGKYIYISIFILGITGIFLSLSISPVYGIICASVDFSLLMFILRIPRLRQVNSMPFWLDSFMLLKISVLILSQNI